MPYCQSLLTIDGIESIYMKIILRKKLLKHHRQSPQSSPMLFFADISEGDDWICMGEFIGITCNVLSDGLLGSFSNAYLGENLSFYGNQPDCRIRKYKRAESSIHRGWKRKVPKHQMIMGGSRRQKCGKAICGTNHVQFFWL